MEDIKYLQLLSDQFPNIPAVSTEIINLKAILNLPKSTELFITDLHGDMSHLDICSIPLLE